MVRCVFVLETFCPVVQYWFSKWPDSPLFLRFNEVREEFLTSREGVTMCDYSSFAKFDIWSAGTEAVEFLQYMCSNDIDVPVGSIVHTGMHNKFGGTKRKATRRKL